MVESSKKEDKKRENFDQLNFENDPDIKKSFIKGTVIIYLFQQRVQ